MVNVRKTHYTIGLIIHPAGEWEVSDHPNGAVQDSYYDIYAAGLSAYMFGGCENFRDKPRICSSSIAQIEL